MATIIRGGGFTLTATLCQGPYALSMEGEMEFGWLAPFGSALVIVALVMLWTIARKAEKAVEELQSIKSVLLGALYDDDRRYSQVRRIAEAVEHSNRHS